MSLKSHEARKLAVAGLAAFAAFGVAAAPASAVQTKILTYKCKYPLIGTNPLSIKIDLDIPNEWPASTPTPPFGITAVATASGNTVPGLSLVEGLAAIEGVSTARSLVTVAGGTPVTVNVPIAIPKYVLPTPVPDPLVLNAAGSTPSLTIDDVGVAEIKLDKLSLNLKATDAAGDPIILPPVTKDIDLNVVKDSDGLPETFDVYCKLDAGQSTVLGSFTLTDTPPPVDILAPTAPGEGVLTPADFTPTSINLKWTPSVDEVGGSGLKEYVIRYEDQEIRVPAGTLTKTLTGLGADSEYFITISGVDNAGNESDPLELFYVTPIGGNTAPTKPGAPTLDAAGTTETALKFSWAASTDNVAVTGYDVYNGATKVATVTGTNATITGLAPNTTYNIKVVANDGGTPVLSTSSDVVPLKTKADTTAPTNPTVTGVPTTTSVALSWSGATDNIGVTGYDVYNGATLVSSVTGTTATVTGLTANTSYTFKIVAKDAAGNKSTGGSATVKTLFVDTVAPTNPTVTATPAKTSVALAWSGATDAVGVTGYDVYNGATLVTSLAGTSTTVSGLTANTSYTFKVVAKDAAGNKSSGGTVTTKTLPDVIPTTGPGVRYKYKLAGTTTLKTLTKGNLKLVGAIDANLTLATGLFTADLTLNDTQGQLTALGFLPVTAKIGFVPSGKTTGSLLDGVLKTSSLVRIKVKEVKLFGAIPLAGGNSCQTKSLSKIDLKSTQAEFAPLSGGPIAGTYSISDLNGCGALNGLVSPLTAGGGNTIAAVLTPNNG